MNRNTSLELADLDTFVAIADTGGVTAAARRLGLPKSIVSRRLSRLEKALGTTLMTRTTRGAALTEAGATFREHAARVQSELETACESIAPEGEVRGRLRVSAPLSFGLTHVAPMLAELARHEVVSQITETWRIQDGDAVRLFHPPARFRADNGQALVPALLAGLGIGMLPDFLADEHLASGKLVRLLAELAMPDAAIYFVRPPGGQAPRKVRALLEILLERFGTLTPP